MTTQHSPFDMPRKELFGAFQKSFFVIFLLLFFGAFALYKLMDLNLDEKASHKDELVTLENRIHQAEMGWLEWLKLSESEVQESKSSVSAEEWHNNLTNEYSEIERLLGHLHQTMNSMPVFSVKDVLAFLKDLESDVQQNKPLTRPQRLKIYQMIEQTNSIDIKLIEMEVSYHYHNVIWDGKLIWSPFIVLGFIALVLIVLGTFLARRLSHGLSHLHYVLDKHKPGGLTIEQNYNKVDEFTDLGRLMDNELSSREFDRQKAQADLEVIQKAICRLDTPFLIANHNGDVQWLSDGFSALWQANESVFESYFGVDEGIGGPLGEQLPDSILHVDDAHRLPLNSGVYRIQVQQIEEGSDPEKPAFFYLMSLVPLSGAAELDVLKKSLELMRQGVWNIPIRLLREDSPFSSFSKELEAVRQSVDTLLNAANDHQKNIDQKVRITKLQQIETLLESKINDNRFIEKEMVSAPAQMPHHVVDELGAMSFLSEQIYDSVLIGYELLLQRLAMVEKDIASDVMLLGEVDRCLNDVRAGVLSSLSAADGESEAIRHRFSLDLNHDIDGVQKHIESIKNMSDSTLSLLQSDRSVGTARLERAKQSVEELRARITALLEKEASLEQKAATQIELTSVDDNNDPIDEF